MVGLAKFVCYSDCLRLHLCLQVGYFLIEKCAVDLVPSWATIHVQ